MSVSLTVSSYDPRIFSDSGGNDCYNANAFLTDGDQKLLEGIAGSSDITTALKNPGVHQLAMIIGITRESTIHDQHDAQIPKSFVTEANGYLPGPIDKSYLENLLQVNQQIQQRGGQLSVPIDTLYRAIDVYDESSTTNGVSIQA